MWVSRSTSVPRTSRKRSSSAWQAAACPTRPVDRAVALDQADDPVGADHGLGEVALLVLDDGELARPVDERSAGGHRSARRWRNRSRVMPAPLLEDLLDEARRRSTDRGEQAPREAVVVGREEVLGGVGDVVHVARSADPVPDGLTVTRPASRARGAAGGRPSGWRRARSPGASGEVGSVVAKADEEVAPEGGMTGPGGVGGRRRRRRRPASGRGSQRAAGRRTRGVGIGLGPRKASTGTARVARPV